MSEAILQVLYDTATDYVKQHNDLSGFADWPKRPQYNPVSANQLPVTKLVQDWRVSGNKPAEALHRAISQTSHLTNWILTYTETEVGADFLNRYGYYELLGPEGHFLSDDVRAYVAYWGPGLHYDWHRHQAEEIYCVLSGSATFHVAEEESVTLRSDGTRLHQSNQPHALTTYDEAVLTFVLWRGSGLADLPKMDAA